MASPSRTLYTGVTNDLERRVWEHRQKTAGTFCARYNVTRLVYFDEVGRATDAIEAEKRIKGWTRNRKIALIEEKNPSWDDLAADWFA